MVFDHVKPQSAGLGDGYPYAYLYESEKDKRQFQESAQGLRDAKAMTQVICLERRKVPRTNGLGRRNQSGSVATQAV